MSLGIRINHCIGDFNKFKRISGALSKKKAPGCKFHKIEKGKAKEKIISYETI